MNVKPPNNTSKWQMGFNSAFKGLRTQTLAVGITREAQTAVGGGQQF
jgi:hypothetical protein